MLPSATTMIRSETPRASFWLWMTYSEVSSMRRCKLAVEQPDGVAAQLQATIAGSDPCFTAPERSRPPSWRPSTAHCLGAAKLDCWSSLTSAYSPARALRRAK